MSSSTTTDEQQLQQALIDEEGYGARPYKDTKGLWTVAHGLCLERNTILPAQWKALLDAKEVELRINPAGAARLLADHYRSIAAKLAAMLPWWGELDAPRQHVLIQMGYQMGVGFVREFPNFIEAVRTKQWAAARLHGLDSDWAREDSPARAHRLMRKMQRGEF